MEIQTSQSLAYYSSEKQEPAANARQPDISPQALPQSELLAEPNASHGSSAEKDNSQTNAGVKFEANQVTQIKSPEVTKVDDYSADTYNNEADIEQIEFALEQVSDFVQVQNRQLNFSFDENSNRSIIKVTDADSGDIIRQIPSEEVLKLAQRINELQTDAGEAIGVLVNRKV